MNLKKNINNFQIPNSCISILVNDVLSHDRSFLKTAFKIALLSHDSKIYDIVIQKISQLNQVSLIFIILYQMIIVNNFLKSKKNFYIDIVYGKLIFNKRVIYPVFLKINLHSF